MHLARMFFQIRPTSVDLNFLDHSFHIKTLMDLNQIFTLARLINIFSASGDSAITISLIYLLRRSIGGLSGSKSETLINRIILYTMGTGLITSICAIMAMVMVCAILNFHGLTMDQWCCESNGTKQMSAFPHTYIYMAFYFNICRRTSINRIILDIHMLKLVPYKVYTNSLLAT